MAVALRAVAMRSNTPTSFAPSHKCTVRTLHGSPPSAAYMRALEDKSRIRSRMLQIRHANYNTQATIENNSLTNRRQLSLSLPHASNGIHGQSQLSILRNLDKTYTAFTLGISDQTRERRRRAYLQQAPNCSVVMPSIQLKQTNVVGQHLYTSHSLLAI